VPPAVFLGTSSGALPAPPTSFIGREPELTEIRRLFAGTRLLTLSGVGGVGKTRLAIELAARLRDEFPDGVSFVDLAPLTDSQLVVPTLARTLGLRDAGSRPLVERLAGYLRSRRLLLVLDNCEHMVNACARLADSLLQTCPELRILATSRQPFRSAGEVAWRVPSLTVPGVQDHATADAVTRSESGRLFAERAQSVRSDFTITDTAAGAIIAICRRLDGIPLALELAAARVVALSAEEIANRLTDRFRFLAQGNAAALPRHQTLRRMIDWSYDWLSKSEQTLFRRLSVFSGGFTLQAAEGVCVDDTIAPADVLDLLARLVDKSLVISEEHDGETRYRLLETVREYGHERLQEAGEETSARGRHRDFFLAYAERADREQLGPEFGPWLARLERELDNVRGALDWCRRESGAATMGLRLADALFRFWDTRGHLREGRDWLAQFLPLIGEGAAVVRARALGTASYLTFWLGNQAEAAAFGEEGLALARTRGDLPSRARVARQYGFVQLWMGQLDRAAALLDEALLAAHETGDRILASMALANLGEVARQRGEYGRAEALLGEALRLAEAEQDLWCVTLHFSILGRVAWSCDDHERAGGYMRESLRGLWALDHRRVISVQLEGLGWVAAAAGQSARAACLLASAEAVRESIGITLVPGQRADHDRACAASRSALGDKAFHSAWTAGAGLSIPAMIEYALSSRMQPPRSPVAPRTAGGPGAHGDSPLTSREREVAMLIARGLTNRQIAKELYVAERTVETHVEHILHKLGVRSRAQAAVWATQHGLVEKSSG